jgi:putative endoribonuclease L-PSP
LSASVDPTGSAASAASTDSATPAASAAPAASVTAVSTAAAPAAVGPYSQAVSTGSTGSTVYISGQVPLDPATGALVEGGIQAQAERVLTNIGAILEAAGLSYADVVKTTVLLADIADFKAVNEVYARFFTGPVLPARAAFAVAGLPLGARVEIEAVALRP